MDNISTMKRVTNLCVSGSEMITGIPDLLVNVISDCLSAKQTKSAPISYVSFLGTSVFIICLGVYLTNSLIGGVPVINLPRKTFSR